MPVLQVPAGEEGGPGGFPNLLKEEEQEEDEEKKGRMMMINRRWRGKRGKI